MRVLICSPAFPPSLGGIERFAGQLAEGLAAAGEEVTVLTESPGSDRPPVGYRIVRAPTRALELEVVRWCQVHVQINLSLRHLWPLVLAPRPRVVIHQTLYGAPGARGWLLGRAKVALSRGATAQVAASGYLAASVGGTCEVIGNPYREDLFRELPGTVRDRRLLFVGRFVSDKGADVLLQALAELGTAGRRPGLTLVGSGPEEPALRRLARGLDLESQVVFAGRRDGEDLVRTMNSHRILVVPSTWNEPFGIVALEGLACGCEVVVSGGGGLPEAVGQCGLTFPNGDHRALARILRDVLDGTASGAGGEVRAQHLRRHRGAIVVERYREVLARVARGA